jgi:hypothetical protein
MEDPMGEQHTTVTSRQCKGMSDPEGDSPTFAQEKVTDADGWTPRGNKFDDAAKDCTKEEKMEEEHTSRTR